MTKDGSASGAMTPGPVNGVRLLEPGPWIIVALGLVFWGIFHTAGTFVPWQERISGVDPVGYYAWFRSLAFDHDLDFANDYGALNRAGHVPGDILVDALGPRTATRRLGNAFAMGPALLWTPFLLAGHLVALLRNLPANGFSQPYVTSVYIANMTYGIAGTVLVYYALRRWFSRSASTIAAIGAWTCSPMLYYTYGQQAMSHAPSYCCVALLLCVWAWLRDRDALWPWMAIGAAVGLATLVRWQNATFALIPAIDALGNPTRKGFFRATASGFAALIVFVPQLIAWKILYGSFLTIPQGNAFMNWAHPRFLSLFFSRSHGLVTWTPLCGVGLAGMCLWRGLSRRVWTVTALALVAQLYVEACAGNIGWSFGMRRLDNCVPFVAVGLASIMSLCRLRNRWAAPVVAWFAIWNTLFVLQYAGLLDKHYIENAIAALADKENISPLALVQMTRLPSGAPFNPGEFISQNRFPREGPPTLRQFTTDKWLVMKALRRALVAKLPHAPPANRTTIDAAPRDARAADP
ncbi:MAG TPA: glycosyltransferase family 39 protein [Candidatus Hydrogenedentes bacterium]|mgnify:CR=1 FL=1|nr:glycosyltransferase family 39 protein [Candidatus Hydrogenedentota bacterium]HOS03396.1 glycosyltransferase family 39 protein [Candidatus Hydrogenedentota bacterium]